MAQCLLKHAIAVLTVSLTSTMAGATVLVGTQGDVRVDSGEGFRPASGAVVLAIGDSVLLAPGASAMLMYADGCRFTPHGGVPWVIREASPCAIRMQYPKPSFVGAQASSMYAYTIGAPHKRTLAGKPMGRIVLRTAVRHPSGLGVVRRTVRDRGTNSPWETVMWEPTTQFGQPPGLLQQPGLTPQTLPPGSQPIVLQPQPLPSPTPVVVATTSGPSPVMLAAGAALLVGGAAVLVNNTGSGRGDRPASP